MFSCLVSKAQIAPGIQWQKNYGGTNDDACQYSATTFDGGYILSGNTTSTNGDFTVNHGNGDWWLVKTNALGVKQWQKSYGGSNLDFLTQVLPDINGGYILVGYTFSNDGDVSGNHGGGDAWILKTDDTGHIVWQKVMGSDNFDCFYFVSNTFDSGYIVAGMAGAYNGDVIGCTYQANGDLWAVKFDKTGAINWKQCYGGSETDIAFGGTTTLDNGIIFCGRTSSSDGIVNNYHGGYSDAWILKIDSTGVQQWNKCYGSDSFDLAQSIIQKPNGNYLCAIESNSINGEVIGNHGGYDYWIVEINDTGEINWSKCYGGSQDEFVGLIIPTFDSGYAIEGTTYSSDSEVTGKHGTSDSGDYWVVKINDTGKIIWTTCLGGSGNDGGACIMQAADSCLVISGSAASNDGDVTTNYGSYDYWLVKLQKESPSKISVVNARQDINVYPTLTNGIVHIEMPQDYENATINLIDITGKQIDAKIKDKGCSRILQLSNLAEGMYFLNIINNNEVNSFKLIYNP